MLSEAELIEQQIQADEEREAQKAREQAIRGSAAKKCCLCGNTISDDEEYTQCKFHGTMACETCSTRGFMPDPNDKYSKWPKCALHQIYRTPALTCEWTRNIRLLQR